MGCQHCLRDLGPSVRGQAPPLRSLPFSWGAVRKSATVCYVRGLLPCSLLYPFLCPQLPGYLTPTPSLILTQSKGCGQKPGERGRNDGFQSLSRHGQVGRRPVALWTPQSRSISEAWGRGKGAAGTEPLTPHPHPTTVLFWGWEDILLACLLLASSLRKTSDVLPVTFLPSPGMEEVERLI